MVSKETKQTDIHAGSLKDSSHTQVAKSYSSHANPPERSSSSTTTTQYKYSSTRISHSEPGPLGVVIRIGERSCSVVEKLNQNSRLNVDDIIISVNGRRYDDMIKLEGGVAAWLDLLKGPGEREFDVLRRQESNAVGAKSRSACAPNSFVPGKNVKAMEVVPMPASSAARDYTSLKNEHFAADPQIWNAAREAGNRPLIAGEPCASSQEEMSAVLRQEERYSLLQEVSRRWITGKYCAQTPQCMSAIRNCLLNNIAHIDVAKHVSDANRHLGSECQRIERERARACVYRENKTLRREKAQEAALKTATAPNTKIGTGIEDLLTKGIPFQRNGIIFMRGTKLQKRKNAAGLEQFKDGDVHNVSSTATDESEKIVCCTRKRVRLELQTTSGIVSTNDNEGFIDMVVITPSNSVEEPMSPLSVG